MRRSVGQRPTHEGDVAAVDQPKVRSAYEVLQVRSDAHSIVIKAAYGALAGLYHPDTNSAPGAERLMADLNAAYEAVRTPNRRDLYDRMLKAASTVGNPAPRQAGTTHRQKHSELGAQIVDFGRYAGWSIADLARHDPDYLRWLSRHSSGLRFRQQIDAAMREAVTLPTASQRTPGR